jgi:hypothetical protein
MFFYTVYIHSKVFFKFTDSDVAEGKTSKTDSEDFLTVQECEPVAGKI